MQGLIKFIECAFIVTSPYIFFLLLILFCESYKPSPNYGFEYVGYTVTYLLFSTFYTDIKKIYDGQ